MISNVRSFGDKYKELYIDNFLKILDKKYKELYIDNFLKILDKTIEKRFPL